MAQAEGGFQLDVFIPKGTKCMGLVCDIVHFSINTSNLSRARVETLEIIWMANKFRDLTKSDRRKTRYLEGGGRGLAGEGRGSLDKG